MDAVFPTDAKHNPARSIEIEYRKDVKVMHFRICPTDHHAPQALVIFFTMTLLPFLIACDPYRSERKLIDQGQYHQALEALQERTTDGDEESAELAFLLGLAQFRLGNYMEAVAFFDKAANIDGSLIDEISDIYLNEAQTFIEDRRTDCLDSIDTFVLQRDPSTSHGLAQIYVQSLPSLLSNDALDYATSIGSRAIRLNDGERANIAGAFWQRGKEILDTSYAVPSESDSRYVIVQDKLNPLLENYAKSSAAWSDELAYQIAEDILSKAYEIAEDWKSIFPDLIDLAENIDPSSVLKDKAELIDLYLDSARKISQSNIAELIPTKRRMFLFTSRARKIDEKVDQDPRFRYLSDIFGTRLDAVGVDSRENYMKEFKESPFRETVASDLLTFYLGLGKKRKATHYANIIKDDFPLSAVLNDLAVLELIGALEDVRMFTSLNSWNKFNAVWRASGVVGLAEHGGTAGVYSRRGAAEFEVDVDLSGDWRILIEVLPYFHHELKRFTSHGSFPSSIIIEDVQRNALEFYFERNSPLEADKQYKCWWINKGGGLGLGEALYNGRYLLPETSFQVCRYDGDSESRKDLFIERIDKLLRVWDGKRLFFSTNNAPKGDFSKIRMRFEENYGLNNFLVFGPEAECWENLRGGPNPADESYYCDEYHPVEFADRFEQAVAMINAFQEEWVRTINLGDDYFVETWEDQKDRLFGGAFLPGLQWHEGTGCLGAMFGCTDPWRQEIKSTLSPDRNRFCLLIGGEDRIVQTRESQCFSLPLRGAVSDAGADFVFRSRDPLGAPPHFEYVQYPKAAEVYVRRYQAQRK